MPEAACYVTISQLQSVCERSQQQHVHAAADAMCGSWHQLSVEGERVRPEGDFVPAHKRNRLLSVRGEAPRRLRFHVTG